jgi:DNA-binding transcriptional LysR family regulator
VIGILRNFVAFAEYGPDVLKISAREFAEQMLVLEEEFGCNIVETTGNDDEVKLTPFGKSFAAYAAQSLRILDDGLSATASQRYAYDSTNYLTIGIARDSITTWAINCVRNFNKMNPGLRLAILADDEMTDRILGSSTIVFWYTNKKLPNFDKLWYIEYKYNLYASEDYIQKNGEPSLDTIHQHQVIAYSGTDGNSSVTNWHLEHNPGFPQLTPTLFAQSRDLIVKMIAEGLGIGSTCDQQSVYYGYRSLKRVLQPMEGPILKSYFMVRSGLSEQAHCNVILFDKLFRSYFLINGIEVFNCD